jgi:uncharacterized protein
MSELFVLDTVVLIKAALSERSPTAAAYKKADTQGILIYSDETIVELERKLAMDKFDKYIAAIKRRQFLKNYLQIGLNIPITKIAKICRDPNDDMFLSLALSAHADCVITEDKDMLVLNPFENIPVLSTPDFLKIF